MEKKPFNITTRVNDKTTDFEVPIDDPFVRHTIWNEWRLISWLPFPRIRTKVEVIIGGESSAVNSVMRTINQLPLIPGRNACPAGIPISYAGYSLNALPVYQHADGSRCKHVSEPEVFGG